MWSFTEALAETVDARTPYNGSHIRKVAEYAGKLADYINEMHEQGKEEEFFTPQRREQLIMGALLHDIGKMIVPLKIMNKEKRLDGKQEMLEARYELISAYYEIDYLSGKLTQEEKVLKQKELEEVKELVRQVDGAEFVTDEMLGKIEEILPLAYEGTKGRIPYFTEEEKDCLRVQKGTLTAAEREVMESHVVMTERILSKVHFNSYYSKMKKLRHGEAE